MTFPVSSPETSMLSLSGGGIRAAALVVISMSTTLRCACVREGVARIYQLTRPLVELAKEAVMIQGNAPSDPLDSEYALYAQSLNWLIPRMAWYAQCNRLPASNAGTSLLQNGPERRSTAFRSPHPPVRSNRPGAPQQ